LQRKVADGTRPGCSVPNLEVFRQGEIPGGCNVRSETWPSSIEKSDVAALARAAAAGERREDRDLRSRVRT